MGDEIGFEEAGGGSFQSEKVRTGTLLRSAADATARRRLRAAGSLSASARTDRLVAALIDKIAARTSSARRIWPWRSMDLDERR